MSTAGYLQDAKNQQTRLATILTNKGITASATEKYSSLVDKVAQIEELKGEERTLENFTSVLDEPKQVVKLEYPDGTTKTLNVKLASKNLFDTGTVDDYLQSSPATLAISDNVLSMTIQEGASTYCYNTKLKFSSGTYTFSSVVSNLVVCRYLIKAYDNSGNVLSISNLISGWEYNSYYKGYFNDSAQITVTIPDVVSYWQFGLVFVNENKIGETGTYSNIQIELSSTATAYTPYITDFSTITVNRYGATPTDNPQTYTPTSTGEVTGITTLYPITTLLTANSTVFTSVSGDVYKTIVPSEGKNGITKVFQPNVTSSIDSNIVPENIKKGITILGVAGTYEG